MNSINPNDPRIAIIAMVGRFPGAANVDQYWQNLCRGVEAITFFTDRELEESGIDRAVLADPAYVKAAGIIAGAEYFDAAFFGYNPREAELMDPQQRIFLELAWEALETAGYNPASYKGAIGVFAGTNWNDYKIKNVYAAPEVLESVSHYQVLLANDKDFITTRVSYKLDLKGPSVNIQTACSSSLVAVH
ncbi:MAG TPA: polyketide synthase, partial [Candidatus Deferrimicrobium sp.]|nr:polyketide synthase [Candidatus Deferrimicrobium sp.]